MYQGTSKVTDYCLRSNRSIQSILLWILPEHGSSSTIDCWSVNVIIAMVDSMVLLGPRYALSCVLLRCPLDSRAFTTTAFPGSNGNLAIRKHNRRIEEISRF